MDEQMDDRERISALADGQLQGEEFARAMQAAGADRAVLEAWHSYHLIGDALRSSDLACGTPGPAFLDRLSARLAQEPLPRPQPAPAAALAARHAAQPAANDGSFRWKMVAGLASVAAFAAVGWSVLGSGGQPGSAQPQLASAPQQAPGAAPGSVLARSEPGVMIRDPRLDEMLAAHRQLGGASALQSSAGFLRNATFESPAR
ncbi:sigma-E factor negative regulatory protein [Ramlibacter tataouinensis]|uniref:sigma-E factor negative regulatory protein n=1 Tax=Ramlibacter tataouinensis TaxID=94132 RepID=UPI0022F38A01|nr:sigma-E factor negative regulatory protein [Ramlibacter tataouinensis]WBY00881.1 sigma-E factor negative regulatory protein [Ramlibacter tataouinensis]